MNCTHCGQRITQGEFGWVHLITYRAPCVTWAVATPPTSGTTAVDGR